jgi:class 3 adenylate cyclase/tetratricopeptide (TPR) repeat protein/ribosomal protein L40E
MGDRSLECLACHTDNPSRAKYCLQCGTRLNLACRKCGTELPASARFCLECGEPIAARQNETSRFDSPQTYTPRHLAERILADKASLEGERKQVTVLFADIKGSTELIADLDPEEADRLLNPIIDCMMEAVHRYEGTVTRVMGDGIMALFGAPIAHEDHAIRACFAALVMQDAMLTHNEEIRREQGFAVHIRVGLHSGEVVVRSIGNDLYMEYTAVGQSAHLAARMEQLADPGSVFISADTLRLAEGYVEVRDLGKVPVKGLSEAVNVYELTGAGLARRRFEAAAARGLTRFVGRDAEMLHLQDALARAHGGHGQVVCVVGEAAVGKSRLFFEFTRSHRTREWLVLESSSLSYDKASAFLPVTGLLKDYFRIEPRDGARTISEKVSGKLVTLDETLVSSMPAFLALLHVPTNDPKWQGLDSSQRREQTFDACKRLLLRESQLRPLILVFEDLHWIDSKTQAFLDDFIGSLPSARILLLMNYRPEYEHQWATRTYYSQLRIDSFPPETAETFLDQLIGSDHGLRPLKRLLIEQTQGNPFFLEESVRTLAETGALAGTSGDFYLTKALTSIEVPASVQTLLAARIDRLPAEEKTILQTASVIGETVPFALLSRIVDMPPDTLQRGIAHLKAVEFLYETSLFPEVEYTFKHALTCQVAYGSLLNERRRALHAKILQAMESLYADRVDELVDRLAHHAFRGENWAKALTYLRQAGVKAETRSAYREAVRCFEEALEALNALPSDMSMLEQAVDVRFDLRTSLFPLGEARQVLHYLEEAGELCGRLDDPTRQAWVSVYMCHYRWVSGQSAEARQLGLRARALAESLDDFSLTITVNYYLGLACLSAGDYPGAERQLRENVTLLKDDLIHERFGVAGYPAAMSRTYLAWVLAERGAFDEGIAYGREGFQMARECNHTWSLVTASWGLASLHIIKGEARDALEILEHALSLSREMSLGALTPGVKGSLGYAYAISGRVSEGLSLLQEAIEAAESSERLALHALLVAYAGDVLRLANRMQGARTYAERALSLARERGERGIEAWALCLMGDIARSPAAGETQAAVSRYEEAFDLAAELGMRPLTARCQLGLAHVHQAAGNRDAFTDRIGSAVEQFREMKMHSWQERAEQALRS